MYLNRGKKKSAARMCADLEPVPSGVGAEKAACGREKVVDD
jgi:hypothetical protein